jgi:hypothetical protein
MKNSEKGTTLRVCKNQEAVECDEKSRRSVCVKHSEKVTTLRVCTNHEEFELMKNQEEVECDEKVKTLRVCKKS